MKVVVVHSGGLDSTVLLWQHIKRGDEVESFAIDYGQRHRIELGQANKICGQYGIPHYRLEIPALAIALPGSSQTDSSVPVPEGHYTAESMKATVVPNRNMILLACALARAIALKYDAVSYAAHAGDHAIYPDCRPEFVDALNGAAKLADWHIVQIERPFIRLNKVQIVGIGRELSAPMHLTWSCYNPQERPNVARAGILHPQPPLHCGVCGTCVERREAFHLAGVPDPTEYASQP